MERLLLGLGSRTVWAALVTVLATVLGFFGVILIFDALPRVTGELSRFLDAIGLRHLVELG